MLLGAGKRLHRLGPAAQISLNLTTTGNSSILLNNNTKVSHFTTTTRTTTTKVSPLLARGCTKRVSLIPGGVRGRPLSSSVAGRKEGEGDEAADLLSFLESASGEKPALRRDIIKFPKIRDGKGEESSFAGRGDRERGGRRQFERDEETAAQLEPYAEESDGYVSVYDRNLAAYYKKVNKPSFDDFPVSSGNETEAAARLSKDAKGQGWYLKDETGGGRQKTRNVLSKEEADRKRFLLENEGGLDPKDPYFRYLIKSEDEKEIMRRKLAKDVSTRGSSSLPRDPKERYEQLYNSGPRQYEVIDKIVERDENYKKIDAMAKIMGEDGPGLDKAVRQAAGVDGQWWKDEGEEGEAGEGEEEVSGGEDEWNWIARARQFDEALDLPEDRPDLTLSSDFKQDVIRPPGYDNARYSMENTIKYLGNERKKSSFGEDTVVDGQVIRGEQLAGEEEWSDSEEIQRRREARDAEEELKLLPKGGFNEETRARRRELEEKLRGRKVVREDVDPGYTALQGVEADLKDPKSFKDLLEEKDPLNELHDFGSGNLFKQKTNPRFAFLKKTTLSDSGLGFEDDVDIQKGPVQQFLDTYQKEMPNGENLNGLTRHDIFGGATDWSDPEPHLHVVPDDRYFDPKQVYAAERQARVESGFNPESDFTRPAAFSHDEWEQLPDDVKEFVKDYVGIVQTRLYLARFARKAHLAQQIPVLNEFLTEWEQRQFKVQRVAHEMYEKLFKEQKTFFVDAHEDMTPYPDLPFNNSYMDALQPREFREFKDLFLALDGVQKHHLPGSYEAEQEALDKARDNMRWKREEEEGRGRGEEDGKGKRGGRRFEPLDEFSEYVSEYTDPEILHDPLEAPPSSLPGKESPYGRARDKEWEKADLWSYFKKEGEEGERREMAEVPKEEEEIKFYEKKESREFDDRKIYGSAGDDLLRELNNYQREYLAGNVEKRLPIALERIRVYMADPDANMPESTPEEVEEMYEFMDNNSWGTLEQWALETIGKPEVKEGKYSDLQGWGEKMKSAILDKANEIRRQEIGSTVQERYENYASISDKDRQYYEFYRQSFKDLQHYTTHARIIQDGFTAVDAMYESLRNFNLSLRRAEVLIPQIPTEYGRYQMRHLNRRYDLTKEVHVNRTSCAGHCLRLQRWREAHIRPLVNTTYQGRVLKGLVDKSSAPHDKLTHQLYTQFDDFGRELISAFRLLSLLNERMDKGFREEKLVRMVEGRLKRLKRMEADLNMKEWRSLNLKFIDHYKDVENACLWEEPIEMLSKQCESDDDLQREPEVQEALQKLMAFWRRKQNRRVKNADYYAKMNAIRKNWWKGKSPNIYAHNQVNVNPALTNLAMSVPEGELRDMALECARAVSFNPRYKHHEKLALVAEFCNKLKDQFFLGMGISKKEFLVLRKQAEQIARGEGDMVIDADDPMMGHEVDPSRYLPKGTSSHETKDAVNFSGKYGV